MIEMGIEVSCGNQPGDSRCPKNPERFCTLPVRLGKNRYTVSPRLEQATNHRIGKRWVIDVRISTDEHKIKSVDGRVMIRFILGKPTAVDTFLTSHRQIGGDILALGHLGSGCGFLGHVFLGHLTSSARSFVHFAVPCSGEPKPAEESRFNASKTQSGESCPPGLRPAL